MDGLAFWVHVTPRARRTAVGGLRDDALRVSVTAPPVDGEANDACTRALAKAFGVRRGGVRIDAGARSRRKRVWIEGDPGALESRRRALASKQALR